MSKPKVGSYWTHKKTGRDYKSLSALVEESLERTLSEYNKIQSFRDYLNMRKHNE